MKKAPSLTKALLSFTLLFMLVAGASFAAFTDNRPCTETVHCAAPAKKGEIIWDSFSQRFLRLLILP